MTSYFRDTAQAARRLVREKGFTTTVLATLALCLGANVVIFTMVHSVLLKPLPFRDPDQLVVIYNSYPKAGVERAGASITNYYERRGQLPALAEIGITRGGNAIIGEAGSPERIAMEQATPSFFELLGTQTALGRVFTEEENVYGKSDVVVLTDGYWRSRCHADPSVIGTTMLVNAIPTTIIGVLPPDFRYLSSEASVWLPLPSNENDRSPDSRHNNSTEMIGRLAPGATVAEAQAQIEALNARNASTDRFAAIVAETGYTTRVEGLRAEHVARIRTTLLYLQAGALLLLLIGAVNLTNLLLIRASARAKELAVRQVLGASRARVASQVVAETILLAVCGGGLGLGLAGGALQSLRWLGTDRLPMGADIALDPLVAGVALAGTLCVGLVLALPVVWFNLHGHLAPVLNAESRSGTTTRAHHRLRHILIVAQVAIAFTVLAGAGLLGLSFKRVLSERLGFTPENLLTANVSLPWTNYRKVPDRYAFTERLLAELRALPGVKAASISNGVPFGGGVGQNATWVEGHDPAPGQSLLAHYDYRVAGDFFETIGIPLVEGRAFEPADTAAEGQVCVIDTDFAKHYWPDSSPLGHHIYDGPPGQPDVHTTTIVGVVAAVKHQDLAETTAMGAIYRLYRQNDCPLGGYLALRTVQAPELAGPAARAAVLRIDPQLPLDDVRTMTARMDASLTTRRSPMLVAGIFAGAALLLATIGIYGVLAYAVAQRQREIGVRMALGAQPGMILRQFLVLGGRLLAIGTLVGIGIAWLAGRLMTGMLFGVTPTNPLVYAATAAVIGIAGLLASFLPSRRAARVHPLEALRSD